MKIDRQHIITGYCIIFYALMIYKWGNGMFLYQVQPSFFYTREDLFTWVFMQTGIHQWLLNNKDGWIFFDIIFYSAPLLFLVISTKWKSLISAAAFYMLLVNWIYIQCYTLYPTTSIEGYTPWLFFPLVFMFSNKTTFSFLMEALRYFFLFFMLSAGIWKFIQGGIFNISQMSGVLLYQHNQMLTNSTGYWQTDFYYRLIQNPGVSWLLYAISAIIELCFMVGFFTKKYDKLLTVLFIIFLFADYIIMRIPYFEMLPFLLTMQLRKKHLNEGQSF